MTKKAGFLASTLQTSALLLALVASPRASAIPPGLVTLSFTSPVPGPPGTAAGWGFTVNNSSTSYLVITGVTASPELTALGAFTDFAAQFQWVVVPPISGAVPGSVTQSYDGVLKTGAGSLLCGTPNAAAAGTITFTFDEYSADPTAVEFDPTVTGSSYGNFLSAPATFGTTPVELQRFEAE